ncbi:hypothetical protein BXZ70DRAFT_211910 [Cristinia sonorae]|uniref:Uncharacterized protein n=1 Tax=Cristinia sonorae TaxID=1940300 RepID=A0A8K0ULS7_9AGAR|nr:hypothetical protein BXZ70DRAFT_211910 [Cristinia sonorae]
MHQHTDDSSNASNAFFIYFFDGPLPMNPCMNEPPAISHAVDYSSQVSQFSPVDWNRREHAVRTFTWVTDINFSKPSSPPSDAPARSDTVFPISYEQPLPQDQREAYYQYLANALGPAQGVQESVGSYKAFMTQQNQTFYDRLLPGPSALLAPCNTPVISSVSHSPVLPHDSFSRLSGPAPVPSSQETEYSKWLLYGRRSVNSSVVSSPVTTPGLESPWFWGGPPAIPSDPAPVEKPLDISDILESPVLRSRHPTAAGMAQGQPSLSAASLNDLLQNIEQPSHSESADSPIVGSEVMNGFSHDISPANDSEEHARRTSVDLRTAKEPYGLEKTVAASAARCKERSRKRTSTRDPVVLSADGED